MDSAVGVRWSMSQGWVLFIKLFFPFLSRKIFFLFLRTYFVKSNIFKNILII